MVVVFGRLAATVLGCGCAGAADDANDGPDAGQHFGMRDSGQLVAEACATRPSLSVLGTIPAPTQLIAVHVVDAKCDGGDWAALVTNNSAEVIHVEAVGTVSPGFTVSADPLPLDLEPGAAFSFALRFSADQPDVVESGTMTVQAREGCQSFAMRGLSGDRSLGRNVQVVDFGRLRPGEVSEPFELVFVRQGPAYDPSMPDTLSVGEALPEDAFRIVSRPSEEFIEQRECEPIRIDLQMSAPNSPGLVEGHLGYETEVSSEVGRLIGFSRMILRGTVIED